MHNSLIKPQNGDRNDCLKIKLSDGRNGPATKVELASWQDGKLTPPTPVTIADITRDCLVLPLIRIQGGVYFINRMYGTSLVAAHILVIKMPGDSSTTQHTLDLGDVEMVEADQDEP